MRCSKLPECLISLFLLFSSLVTATASQLETLDQKPLGPGPLHNTDNSLAEDRELQLKSPDRARWQLDFASTAPHFFASAYTLLQQWSNTIFPNGHNIALVEIPVFTHFYHGRYDDAMVPESPEWLSFDVEMAYAITGGTNHSFMLTYQATRPLKLLYFDGESATLMGLGQMDTQMLHLYGNVTGPESDSNGGWRDFLAPEYRRAMGFCTWLEEKMLRGKGGDGRYWGVEGVVRMNAGFEVIWCDFASDGLKLMSLRNVTALKLPQEDAKIGKMQDERGTKLEEREARDAVPFPLPHIPKTSTSSATDPQPTGKSPQKQWQGMDREPFTTSMFWGWFKSAAWHYGSSRAAPGARSGETRARVRSCAILSYYSPRFEELGRRRTEQWTERLNLTNEGTWKGPNNETDTATGLTKLARRRRYHDLASASESEGALMKGWSEDLLRGFVQGDDACSGMDWVDVMSEIVQRTAGHLRHMETLLGSLPQEWNDNDSQAVWLWMFDVRDLSHMFTMPFMEYPTKDEHVWESGSDLYDETYSRCRFHYTRLLVDMDLSSEEQDLRWAVEETFGAICGVLLTVAFSIEKLWFSHFDADPFSDKFPSPPSDMGRTTTTWKDSVTELIAWLGWEGEWITCEKTCGWDEHCSIPMWPVNFIGQDRGGNRTGRPPGGYPPPEYGPGYPYGGRYGRKPRPPGGGNWTMPRRAEWMMGSEEILFRPVCVKRRAAVGGAW